MPYTIENRTRSKLPPDTRRDIELLIGTTIPAGDWVIHDIREGVTHKNQPLHIARMNLAGANKENLLHVFVGIDPSTEEVVAVRGLHESEKACTLTSGMYGAGERFTVNPLAQGKGIGAALTAHAIAHAMKLKKPVKTGLIVNHNWKMFFERIGCTMEMQSPLSREDIHAGERKYVAVLHPSNARYDPKNETSYAYYLLRKKQVKSRKRET